MIFRNTSNNYKIIWTPCNFPSLNIFFSLSGDRFEKFTGIQSEKNLEDQ